MSMFNDKSLKSVAEAVKKIMQQEELKGNQHKIDANKNGKIDGEDFKLLRAKKGMKKEETESLEEKGPGLWANIHARREKGLPPKKPGQKGYPKTLNIEEVDLDEAVSRKHFQQVADVIKAHPDQEKRNELAKHHSEIFKKQNPRFDHNRFYTAAGANLKEETELDEAFPTVADGEKNLKAKEGKTSKGTLIKTKTGVRHERDYDDTPEPEVKRGRGRPKGSMSGAKKRLSEMRQEYFNYVEEEVDNETFKKELEDQKAKFDGKKKGADVAKPSVQAVKQEEVEQIDEVSKKTLGSYIKAASHDVAAKGAITRHFADKSRAETAAQRPDLARVTMKKADKAQDAGMKRRANMAKAVDRLTKEDVELDERTLSSGETKKKEDYVKGMKKKMSGFKQRYGDRAKSVMYATATKMAKKD